MNHVLLDSDVLLDGLLNRLPFVVHSKELISLCENGKLKGFCTPVMIANIYYLLRKTASHQKVAEKLIALTHIIPVVTIGANEVSDALHSGFKDFEDALQNFSAVHSESIDIIITRNIKDYKTSSLSICTPETYLKTRS